MPNPHVLSEEWRVLRIWMICEHGRKEARCCVNCYKADKAAAADAALTGLAHHTGLATGPGDTYEDLRDEIVRGVQQARREAAVGALREAEIIVTGSVIGQPKAYRWHKQIHNSGHDRACHGIARRIRTRAKEIEEGG